ncbi:hypothetical protein AVEN_274857-1 [Araneus ventricosus]|uniref:Uncharacterized protein n=1 Tax=Araneus ventricosus TaxID=182803 RepID=A0A4Y2IAN6_ARAVE|nr:hypothetical protein AVEN_274857-1 [Araneus ventricosus]
MASNFRRNGSVYLNHKEIEDVVNNFSDLEYSDSEGSYIIESESRTESELSEHKVKKVSNDCRNDDIFQGKNFKWCKKEPNLAVRTQNHNIIL